MSFLRHSVANPVAANMLMILILGGGLLTAFWIPRELFPEFSADVITVSVPYPGASPSDVEQSICLKIEDKVTGIDGVDEVTAVSREGLGVVTLELTADADARRVLDEVKSKVEQVDFPADAEDYEAVELILRQQVIMIAVAGDAPERTLKEIAEEVRDELVDLPEVSQVTVSGVREYEITVDVSEQSLRRHRLTLSQVAGAIRQGALDLPAGTVKTSGGELTIRVVGQLYKAKEYEELAVLSRPDGTIVRLGDIATVREGFEDVDIGGQFNGKPSVLVGVHKTADEDTLEIVQAVRRYVHGTDEPPQDLLGRAARQIKELFWGRQETLGKKDRLPEGIVLETWSDYSKFISDRLSMLIRNGLQGLVLVVLVLWLFLGLRLSFWVALGIPVSLMGTVLVLHLAGTSLNMMSMFALIMALGLIVDDAIIVGENVYTHSELGDGPRLAAVEGTRRVLFPVIAAVTTTWLAFAPLVFIPGIMGRFIKILPYTVMLALAFSLLECLVILPPHLAHSLRRRRERQSPTGRVGRLGVRVRAGIDSAVRTFIDVHFIAVFRKVTRYRYVTVTVLVGAMTVVAAARKTGHVPFTPFPKLDSDTLRAKLVLPTGTPITRTKQVARQITGGALALNDQFEAESGDPVVQRVYALLGQESRGGDSGSHIAEVIVELLPAEDRGIRSEKLTRKWRESIGSVPDKLSLTFGTFHGGPGGKPLEIRLLGDSTEQIEPAAERLKAALAGHEGVFDIEDDALPGNMEMRVRLKSEAHSLGINLQMLAGQLRDAFYGNESLKIQRGRDEVKVRVRYPEAQRRSLGDVEEMRVRTAAGAEVPFVQVADVQMERGYTTLRRVGRKSVVTISADIDEKIANAEKITDDLKDGGFLTELAADYPRLRVDFRGQRRQALESFQELKIFSPIALLGIFTILAAVFKSYFQPVIIMVAIPFGVVGAVIGHWLLGFDVTLLSLFGIVALTGIVVNDSLVLIDFINRRVRGGDDIHAAVEAGARRRFRPIFLTTATTLAGMLPILLERSFQAQFLKPMVVAITSGLVFATLLTLLAVPSLYMIGNDLRRCLRWLRTGRWPRAEEVVRRDEPMGPETQAGDLR